MPTSEIPHHYAVGNVMRGSNLQSSIHLYSLVLDQTMDMNRKIDKKRDIAEGVSLPMSVIPYHSEVGKTMTAHKLQSSMYLYWNYGHG